MKLTIFLALCCLIFGACASPIVTIDSQIQPTDELSKSEGVQSGRQTSAESGPTPVAAPAETDDDDDDDDDDDVDLDITEDDDDDDDDEAEDDEDEDDDDDDDDDYFERIIDDILGDDDDDDDDDETPGQLPAASAIPVAQATTQLGAVVPQQAAKPISNLAAADFSSVDYPAPGETLSAVADSSTTNSESAAAPVYDDLSPEEQAAGTLSKPDDNAAAGFDSSLDNTDTLKPEALPAGSTDDDDDDDDDEDDDDIDVTLDEDDDDDDEEDDDEEDDDDDDDEIEDVVGDDVIEAKRSRSLETSSDNAVPPIYITKYNRFVDNILERINRILRKNYDPVNVRLHNNNNNKKKKNSNSKHNSNKKNKNRRRHPTASQNGNRRPGHRSEDIARTTTEAVEATVNESLAAISAQLIAEHPKVEQVTLVYINSTNPAVTHTNAASATTELATTKRSSDDGMINRARPQQHDHNKNSKKKTKKDKNKQRQRPGAKATLYGLSSIRREGDVTVNMMSSHTTVKTKFTVGPLILKVEREFGRGAKKDIRSATATTTEMVGKLNLRVLHGGAATLHSIKVMQPKQVRVESSDDHDKTREYVWKRSSHIAHVVSQKLKNATKSMLQPPPIPNNGIIA